MKKSIITLATILFHSKKKMKNGRPGFCFAVYRWDGQAYKVNRYEYEGKACEL